MVNKELIDLCRTVVAAIQDTDSFEAPQLKRLLLHIVPQLLVEIDILGGVLESMRLPGQPSVPKHVEVAVEKAAVRVASEAASAKRRKPAVRAKSRPKRRAGKKVAR
jgi:hypothetical protein